MPKFNVTPYEAAVFARLAYPRNGKKGTPAVTPGEPSDPVLSDITLPATWRVVLDEEGSKGLHVTVSVSELKKALVISVRGTNNLVNLRADLQGIMMPDVEIPEFGRGRDIITGLVDEIVASVDKTIVDKTMDMGSFAYNLVFNGHSLGGFLANLAMLRIISMRPELAERVESLTMDAPGVANFYQDAERYSDQVELIHNYVSVTYSDHHGPVKPNWVNACQPHVGNLYLLDMPNLSEYQKLVPDEAAAERDQQMAGRARSAAGYGSGLVSQASGSLAGGSFASAKAASGVALGLSAIVASAFGYSAYRAGTALLWLHSIDNIIGCMNPYTGRPYRVRTTDPAKYPLLKRTVFQEVVANTLELYSVPRREAIIREISNVTGAGYREVYEGPVGCDYSVPLFIVSALLGVVECFLGGFTPIFIAVGLSLIALLQAYSPSVQDNLIRKVNHVGQLSLSNRSLDPNIRNQKMVGLEQMQQSVRVSVQCLDNSLIHMLNRLNARILFPVSMMLSFAAHAVALLQLDWFAPIITMGLGSYCAIVMALLLPLLPAVVNSVRLTKGLAGVYSVDYKKNVLCKKVELFDPKLQSRVSSLAVF